jgi:hypothetical protein
MKMFYTHKRVPPELGDGNEDGIAEEGMDEGGILRIGNQLDPG